MTWKLYTDREFEKPMNIQIYISYSQSQFQAEGSYYKHVYNKHMLLLRLQQVYVTAIFNSRSFEFISLFRISAIFLLRMF